MLSKFCKEYTFLRSGITAAHHKNLFPCKELPITGGTVCNTSTFVFFLTLESNGSGMRTGSQQNTKAAEIALSGIHCFDVPI